MRNAQLDLHVLLEGRSDVSLAHNLVLVGGFLTRRARSFAGSAPEDPPLLKAAFKVSLSAPGSSDVVLLDRPAHPQGVQYMVPFQVFLLSVTCCWQAWLKLISVQLADAGGTSEMFDWLS